VRRISRLCVFTVILVTTLLPTIVAAQTNTDAWSIGVGYQVLHIPDETFPFGMNLDIAVHVVPSMALVGEFGFATDDQHESSVSGNLKFYTVAGGARWTMTTGSVRRVVSPYVQMLVGAARSDADLIQNGMPFNDGDWAFMLQPGVGVTVPLTAPIGVMGQIDYRRAFFYGSENEWRVVLGVRVFGR